MPIIYEENNNSVNTSTDNASTQTESQSRVEEALQAIVDGSDGSQLPASQSRVEALLKEIFDSGGSSGSGGGGGSVDYDTIINAAIQKLTPDYENAEPAVSVESGNHIYTATDRCIMNLMFCSKKRKYCLVLINGKEVAEDAAWSTSSTAYGGSSMINTIWLPLRAGDVVSIQEDASLSTNDAWVYYIIIPYKA